MDSPPPPPSTTSSSSSDNDHPRNSDHPFWCNSCSRAVNLSQADAEHGDQLTCPFCNGRSLEPMIPVPSAFSLMFPLFMGILGLPAQLPTGVEYSETDHLRDAAEDGDERVILIDPINQTMVIHVRNLDGLLEELNEMDLMKSSSSPASKESVEAMPLVKVVDDDCVCAICLESFGEETEGKGFRAEAREMPCKHKYHGECILKWLEKQRTCPVCRFQMPAEKESSKAAAPVGEGGGAPERRNVRRSVMFSFPWLTGFFSAWGGADGGGDNATPR